MNSGNWGGFRTLWCIFNRDCDMFSIIIFSRILFYRLVENAVRKHANRSEKTLHQVNCILCLPTKIEISIIKKVRISYSKERFKLKT